INSIPISLLLDDVLIVNQTFDIILAPGESTTVNFTENPINLNAIGEYNIKVFKTAGSFTDEIHANDTLSAIIRQIDNLPLDLSEGYIENFELTGRGYYNSDFIGLWGADRWDFF